MGAVLVCSNCAKGSLQTAKGSTAPHSTTAHHRTVHDTSRKNKQYSTTQHGTPLQNVTQEGQCSIAKHNAQHSTAQQDRNWRPKAAKETKAGRGGGGGGGGGHNTSLRAAGPRHLWPEPHEG